MVGVFHLLWFLWVVTTELSGFHGWISLLDPVWMLAYSFAWISASFGRKWGALTYIGLTIVNAILFVSLKTAYERTTFVSPIFLIDDLFCFFLLFYFKRFD